jgi:hypothetical protein
VLYHLYVLQSVEREKADAEVGRTMSHEDVSRGLRKKRLAAPGNVDPASTIGA